MSGLGLEFMTTLVQVNLLRAKHKSLAISERNGLHSQCFRIEVNGHINIRNRQDEMIKVVDSERHSD